MQSGPSGNRDDEKIIKLLKTVQVLNFKIKKIWKIIMQWWLLCKTEYSAKYCYCCYLLLSHEDKNLTILSYSGKLPRYFNIFPSIYKANNFYKLY